MDDLKSSAEVGYQLVKKKLITILNDMVSRTFNGAKLTFFFSRTPSEVWIMLPPKGQNITTKSVPKKNF